MRFGGEVKTARPRLRKCGVTLIAERNTTMPGSWQPLNNQPSFNVDAMLLLTDGSIMCHEYQTPNWHKLVPDNDSDYANGS
jgi:hypothetical protein